MARIRAAAAPARACRRAGEPPGQGESARGPWPALYRPCCARPREWALWRPPGSEPIRRRASGPAGPASQREGVCDQPHEPGEHGDQRHPCRGASSFTEVRSGCPTGWGDCNSCGDGPGRLFARVGLCLTNPLHRCGGIHAALRASRRRHGDSSTGSARTPRTRAGRASCPGAALPYRRTTGGAYTRAEAGEGGGRWR